MPRQGGEPGEVVHVPLEARHGHVRPGRSAAQPLHLAGVAPGEGLVLGQRLGEARREVGSRRRLPPRAPPRAARPPGVAPGYGQRSGVTRLATDPATGIPALRRCSWKKSASSTESGLGLATSTNPTPSWVRSVRTAEARCLKPSYMPWNCPRKSPTSERTSDPVKRERVFATKPVPTWSRRAPKRPASRAGAKSLRAVSLPTKSRIRSGASRKSRAWTVGGVSRTMRS